MVNIIMMLIFMSLAAFSLNAEKDVEGVSNATWVFMIIAHTYLAQLQ